MKACVLMKIGGPPRRPPIVEKLSSASTMSAAPAATAVPEPIATPYGALEAGVVDHIAGRRDDDLPPAGETSAACA